MYHLVRAAAFVRVLDHAQVQIPTFPKPKSPTFLERHEGIYLLNRRLHLFFSSYYKYISLYDLFSRQGMTAIYCWETFFVI